MKKALLLALALCLSGCSVISGKVEQADGGNVSLTVMRFAWKTDRVHFARTGTNSTKIILTIERSGSDAVTAKAITEGVVEGLVKGAKGGVP